MQHVSTSSTGHHHKLHKYKRMDDGI